MLSCVARASHFRMLQVATAIRGAIIIAKMSVVPVRRGYWGRKNGMPHTVPNKVSLTFFRVWSITNYNRSLTTYCTQVTTASISIKSCQLGYWPYGADEHFMVRINRHSNPGYGCIFAFSTMVPSIVWSALYLGGSTVPDLLTTLEFGEPSLRAYQAIPDHIMQVLT